MSIQNAKLFFKKVQTDKSFRDTIIVSDTESDFSAVLDEFGIPFTSSEIEEAFNMLHVQCQFEHEAENLKQAYIYYQLLVSAFIN
jgi:predicted ribosomally synthesized peptide with nif11-like leader